MNNDKLYILKQRKEQAEVISKVIYLLQEISFNLLFAIVFLY